MRIKEFPKTIAAAGTPEALKTTSTLSYDITVLAYTTNSGTVTVGESTVGATSFPLAPGASIRFQSRVEWGPYDMNDIWAKAASDGDKVHVVYGDHTRPTFNPT